MPITTGGTSAFAVNHAKALECLLLTLDSTGRWNRRHHLNDAAVGVRVERSRHVSVQVVGRALTKRSVVQMPRIQI